MVGNSIAAFRKKKKMFMSRVECSMGVIRTVSFECFNNSTDAL